jgi:pimeloyl-ACP methyl ester carboxylesterase
MTLPCRLVRLLLALVLGFAALGARASGPLAPGDHQVTVHGLKLAYSVAGRGPVALVPAPAWGPSVQYLVSGLQPMEQWFTMVYVDPRGTGRSEAPPPGDVSWATLVADLEALRAHLGQERVWLIGHSMAGVMATHYALAQPQRVQGLVLIGSLGAADKAYDADIQRRLARRKDQPWFPAALKALQENPSTQADFDRGMREMLPLYFARPDRIPSVATALLNTPLSLAAWQGAARRLPDVLPRLGEIKAPTLLVVGMDDFIASPTQSTRLHQGIAGSKLLVVEDAGHFPWLEQPDAFFRGIRGFLPTVGHRPD